MTIEQIGNVMILETAKIKVDSGNHAGFELAVSSGVTEVLSKAKGFKSFQLLKGIEESDTYLLHITWETLEDHTIGFRESDLFTKWREIIGPFFAASPEVTHWAFT